MHGSMIIVAVLLCNGSALVAQAAAGKACQRPGAVASTAVYALVDAGGARACVAPSRDSDGSIVPCLRIGAIYVGQPRSAIELALGQPWRRVKPREPASSSAAYLVMRDEASGQGSYYVIEYERVGPDEVALSVQFTGSGPGGPGHAFSCLVLGDPESEVRGQLGAPADITTFQFSAEDVRGTVWWYDPDPVSIEIVAGRVYSMRVVRPREVAPRRR